MKCWFSKKKREIELSSFDKKYYDLVKKGLVDSKCYEFYRLLYFYYKEKGLCSLVDDAE